MSLNEKIKDSVKWHFVELADMRFRQSGNKENERPRQRFCLTKNQGSLFLFLLHFWTATI